MNDPVSDAVTGGAEWWWQLALTWAIGLLPALLLVRAALWPEDGRSQPTVRLRSERRSIRQLRLPDAAVRRVVRNSATDAAGTGRLHAMSAKASASLRRGLAHFYNSRAIAWDDLELELEPHVQSSRPLLVFVNTRSGGCQGVEVLLELQRLLHPAQTVDLRHEGPEAALRWWSRYEGLRYRVLVCGGDGTVGWVLGCLERLELDYVPPVAILPLGTGNDLARVLGWGGGYNGNSIAQILLKVSSAHAAVLDRWAVTCRDAVPAGRPATLPPAERKEIVMCNYFGIGVDAAVALDFHMLRERSPHLFFSRMVNKLWYFQSGTINVFRKACSRLSTNIYLECDGQKIEVPPNLEGIIVLNIASFGGGSDLWGSADTVDSDSANESESESFMVRSLTSAKPSMRDRRLEVVGVHGSFQLGAAQVGLYSAKRLAQASRVVIRNHVALPVQVDGEPWLFAKGGEVVLSWKSEALMLAHSAPGKHAEATDVVEWGLQQNIITTDQRNALMKEIARRADRMRSHADLASMG
eukprot:TRINITY_DN62745_c0_g1_i1.p1 TRINITY_DN62745_c0_g1~~TRINITY_DN62745_c0_g1_i1.p1  ORF type:complete len:553 (-),score=61.26 TRINITY_DN62745_c0_g1_i1:376-1950(-)